MVDTAGCLLTRQQTINVIPGFTIDSITQSDTNICVGGTTSFGVALTPPGGHTYSWTPAGIMNNPTIANPIATFNSTGTTAITVTIDAGIIGCEQTDTLTVNVGDIPAISITTPDTLLDCSPSLPLDVDLGAATVPNAYVFEWNFGATLNDSTLQNPDATPNGAITNYIVTVTDTIGGCFDRDTIEVRSCCITPSISFTDVTCNGLGNGKIFASATALNSSITIEFFDSTSTFLLQTSSGTLSDSLVNVNPGTYVVVITDTIGCSFTDTVTISEPNAIFITGTSNDTTICINGTALLSATSTGGIAPINLIWSNGFIGNSQNVNALIDSTVYNVYAQDSNGCISASSIIVVNLHPPIVVDSLIPDERTICPNTATSLTAYAIGGSGSYTYNWLDGNNVSLGTTTVPFFTVAPTFDGETFTVVVTDTCSTPAGSLSVQVFWPPTVFPDYTITASEGCENTGGVTTFITNTTPNLNSLDIILWDFGNGTISETPVANFGPWSWNDAGSYPINLKVTDQFGCSYDTTISTIIVHDSPIADFSWSPNPTNYLNSEITFNNLSTDNAFNNWIFTTVGQSTSSDVDPVFQFPSNAPGTYNVTLTVTNSPGGCQDVSQQFVVIDDVFLFYVPNAFTPNGDNVNDVFKAEGEGIDMDNYKMSIFNRWGTKIFETNDMKKGWDGTYKGEIVPTGSYVWQIRSKEKFGNVNHKETGKFKILR